MPHVYPAAPPRDPGVWPISGVLCAFLNSSHPAHHGLHKPQGVFTTCNFLKAGCSCSLPLPLLGLCLCGLLLISWQCKGLGTPHRGWRWAQWADSGSRDFSQVPFLGLSGLICEMETIIPISRDCVIQGNNAPVTSIRESLQPQFVHSPTQSFIFAAKSDVEAFFHLIASLSGT